MIVIHIKKLLCLIFMGIILGSMSYIFIHSNWMGKRLFPLAYEQTIFTEAKKYDLDPHLVAAVIYVESRFQPRATSQSGARGLMQIMPGTGKWVAQNLQLRDFQVEDLYEPVINIQIGCWYLNSLREQFGEDLLLILAAYNGGRGNVTQWLEAGIWNGEWQTIMQIPFSETRNYVVEVILAYKQYQHFYS